MFAEEQLIKDISSHLAWIKSNIKIQASNGYTDACTSAEYFFMGFLNQLYSLSLQNMNQIQSNYPAIDLGDRHNRICIQVTAETTASKLKRTIKKFKEHNLDEYYDELVFLIIDDKAEPTISEDKISIGTLNLSKLVSKLRDVDLSMLQYLLNFMKNQLVTPQNTARTSILRPTPTSISAKCPKAYINFLGYSDDQNFINSIDNELNKFENALKNCSHNQREFIFYILRLGTIEDYSVVMATSELLDQFGDHMTRQCVDALTMKDIGGIDPEYEPRGEDRYISVFELHFSHSTEDFDFFSTITKCCNQSPIILKKIFIDLDFSSLS